MTRHVPPQRENVKGSQKWTQFLINEKPELLSLKIIEHVNLPKDVGILWLSPMKEDEYAEYRGGRTRGKKDCAFLDVLCLNLEKLPLEQFWPVLGPQWDALGRINDDCYFIVESKGHPGEMKTSHRAKSIESREKINKSLTNTKTSIGIKNDNDWSKKYYQYANRVAHLNYLRLINGNPVYLIFINFLNDYTHVSTSYSEWEKSLKVTYNYLGLNQGHLLDDFIVTIFIDVNDL